MNVYEVLPGYCRLARLTDLSQDAGRRLKWFDYYYAHGENARLTCRHFDISPQTFYRWKKKFAGLGVAEVRRLKLLEEENKKLKALVADLSLDKQILQDVLSKKL